MGSKGRMRWFWMLQAAGWALWLGDQMVWIVFDLVLKKKLPAMYPADALLFLAGAPMIAGLLLAASPATSERTARLGLLDFFSCCCGGSISTFRSWFAGSTSRPTREPTTAISICFPAQKRFCIAGVLLVFWRESSGRWKKFYGCFCGAFVFNGIAFYVLNRAIERDVYYTGSWYDIPYSRVPLPLFTAVALAGTGTVAVA